MVDRLTLHINFDTDKADIREADAPDMQKAIAFVKKHPGSRISDEGFTDDRGSVEALEPAVAIGQRALHQLQPLPLHGRHPVEVQSVGRPLERVPRRDRRDLPRHPFSDEHGDVPPFTGTVGTKSVDAPRRRGARLRRTGTLAPSLKRPQVGDDRGCEDVAVIPSLEDRNEPAPAMAVRRLGQLALRAGNSAKALEYCGESLRLNRAVSDPRGILACLASFAAIAIANDEYERAAALAASVEAQIASVGIGLLYTDRLEYQRNVGILQSSIGTKALAAALRKGQALSVEEAIAFALQVT